MQNKISLAQFVSQRREKLNLSQDELACLSGLEKEQVISIEQGFETFLPTTIRQKLAKGLKVENKEIKHYEKRADFNLVKKDKMEEIREAILLNYITF